MSRRSTKSSRHVAMNEKRSAAYRLVFYLGGPRAKPGVTIWRAYPRSRIGRYSQPGCGVAAEVGVYVPWDTYLNAVHRLSQTGCGINYTALLPLEVKVRRRRTRSGA